MANVTVLVPPDLRIECDVERVIGSFEVAREAESTRSPDAPLVRLTRFGRAPPASRRVS